MEERKYEPLIQISLLTLGYLMGKEGLKAYPVAPLAKALFDAGVTDCTYVNTIIEMNKDPKACT